MRQWLFAFGLMLMGSAHAETVAKVTKLSQAPEPLAMGNVMSVMLGLVFVLLLLFVTAWMIRRLQRVSPHLDQVIQVQAQLSLGLKERVLLLRVGEENVLVGCTPGTIRTLHVWQGPALVSEPTATNADFLTHFKSALASKGLALGTRHSAQANSAKRNDTP